jgi:hypothetical protein
MSNSNNDQKSGDDKPQQSGNDNTPITNFPIVDTSTVVPLADVPHSDKGGIIPNPFTKK